MSKSRAFKNKRNRRDAKKVLKYGFSAKSSHKLKSLKSVS